MAIDITGPFSRVQRVLILGSCLLAVVILTAVENYLGPPIPLGGLFLIPLLVAATCLSRGWIFAVSILTAIGREYFENAPWGAERPHATRAELGRLYRWLAVCGRIVPEPPVVA